MDKIIIYGSGNHARVVAYNIKEQGKYSIAAFVTTDNTDDTHFDGIPLFAGYRNFDDEMTEHVSKVFGTNLFAIGFGAMKYRKDVYSFLIANGWDAPNIIHPSAVVSPNAKIGGGVLIEAGCLITPNPIIGCNVVINTGSQVNHDNVIEDHVYFASGVITSGSIVVGENTLIDDGVIISMDRKVGKNCIIGAGSVVTKDVPDNVIAYGNPCRIIRENSLF